MDLDILAMRRAPCFRWRGKRGLEAGAEGLAGGWVVANKLGRKQTPWAASVWHSPGLGLGRGP